MVVLEYLSPIFVVNGNQLLAVTVVMWFVCSVRAESDRDAVVFIPEAIVIINLEFLFGI